MPESLEAPSIQAMKEADLALVAARAALARAMDRVADVEQINVLLRERLKRRGPGAALPELEGVSQTA